MTTRAAELVGMAGAVIFIAAYAYATFARAMDKLWFNSANLIGAVLLLISLSVEFNLASFVLEVVWALIALGGLGHELWRRIRR